MNLRTSIKAFALGLLATWSPSLAVAQTTPTGTITGHVEDTQGGLLPGVTVTASSTALQGTRSAVTSKNGDYIIPFLPAGEYTVKFELQGFAPKTATLRVQLAESMSLDAKLSVGGMTEEVLVTADTPADFTQSTTAAASYKAEQIDRLPVGRDIRGAVLLAPGTTSTGPDGNVTFSGAASYEGLFLLNGVVLNETLRNQERLLFIEDAIEETKTSTAAISAEYGRFSGGVANVLTKSGGNKFSGSVRVTFDNDKWRALTPFEKSLSSDPRRNVTVPTYEATLGGPILKDKLFRLVPAVNRALHLPKRRTAGGSHHLRQRRQRQALRGQAHLRPFVEPHDQGRVHEEVPLREQQHVRRHHGHRELLRFVGA